MNDIELMILWDFSKFFCADDYNNIGVKSESKICLSNDQTLSQLTAALKLF